MYGPWANSNVIPTQRNGIVCFVLFHAVRIILKAGILKKDKTLLTQFSMNGSILNILSFTYQWLIRSKIAKIYFLEMRNTMDVSNWHASVVCFLIVCSECIMKIASIRFIMALEALLVICYFPVIMMQYRTISIFCCSIIILPSNFDRY